MKLKVLPLSLFLCKSYFFSFVPIFAFINDNKTIIDLAGNVWFGQDANISSKNTQSTMLLLIVLARNSLSLAE